MASWSDMRSTTDQPPRRTERRVRTVMFAVWNAVSQVRKSQLTTERPHTGHHVFGVSQDGGKLDFCQADLILCKAPSLLSVYGELIDRGFQLCESFYMIV